MYEATQVIWEERVSVGASGRSSCRWAKTVRRSRRDLGSAILVFGRRHLERVLSEFLEHYHQARPHQGRGQRVPCSPTDVTPSTDGQVERRDRLGGLLHEYSRAA